MEGIYHVEWSRMQIFMKHHGPYMKILELMNTMLQIQACGFISKTTTLWYKSQT